MGSIPRRGVRFFSLSHARDLLNILSFLKTDNSLEVSSALSLLFFKDI